MMVAYSFKKRFIDPIQQGTKRQTIRIEATIKVLREMPK